MCVIALVTDHDKRPTTEEVKAMWESNPAGGGVAWRAGKAVKWEKGLELERMQEYNQTLEVPYVLHFRVPSVGGHSKLLTHPFPLELDVPLDLQGETEKGVLFHNGTLSNWETLRREWTKPGMEFPGGIWSDSRTMAYLVAHYCPKKFGFLENVLSAEKILIFTPETIKIGGPTGDNGRSWTLWEKRFLVSNDFFEFRLRPQTTTQTPHNPLPAHYQGCINTSPGGQGSKSKESPPTHETLPGGCLVTSRREIPASLMLIAGAPEVPETAPFVEAMVRYCRFGLSKKALKRAHRRYTKGVMRAIQAQAQTN